MGPAPATLSSIAVTPANPSLAAGNTKQFAASGTYSDATSHDITTQVTWSSSNTSVATVNSSGLATAVAAGTATITATSGSITGNTTLTVTAATIVFNYDYDTNGFFTPARRELVEKAAATLLTRMTGTTWERVDAGATGGSYELAFINPSTCEVSWSSNVVIPENQITVYLGAVDFSTLPPSNPMHSSTGTGATQLMSIRNVSGGIAAVLTSASQYRPINASITFDLQGIQGFSPTITRQWHFDSDGNLATDDRDPNDPHYNDYDDFYTTVIHELAHVLGIHNPQVFYTYMGIDYDPNFCRAWMSLVQPGGSGGYVFTGSNAKQWYYGHVGVNILLDNTECHWADGVRSGPSGQWPSVTHEGGGPFRVWFSEMEFQALKDIGYNISAP